MMQEISLRLWLNGPARQIGWLLVHSVWQGAAIALLLAIVLRLMERRSSGAKYLVSCAALLAIPAASIVTFSLRQSSGAQLVAALPGPAIASTAMPVMPTVAAIHQFDLQQSLGYAATAWIVGVALLAVWHLCGWLNLLRWRAECSTIEGTWRSELDSMMNRMRITGPIRLLGSARLATPAVVGIFKPAILIPIALAAELTPEQAAAILAHELAHIRRHDYLINLIQTAIETLLFYHPAVWWISNQIRRERENCCDDLAAAMSDPIEYSRALLAAEGLRTTALAMGLGGHGLRSRIGRLIDPRPSRRRGSALFAALIAVLLVCLATPIHSSLGQSTTSPANAENKNEVRFVRVVVGENSVMFDGKPTTLELLPKLLENVADRGDTVLQLAYASNDVKMGWYAQVQSQILNDTERSRLGFKYFTEVGLQPAGVQGLGAPDPAAMPAPLPSLPQAPVSQLTQIVPLKIGHTDFAGGDNITITQVRGTSDTISPGNTYQVKGTYHLASHDQATLAMSVAATRPQDARGFWASNQSINIQRGDGEFTVYECIPCPGYPHITIYADGKSVSDVYFGTGDSLLKK